MRKALLAIAALTIIPILLHAADSPEPVTVPAGTKVILRATEPITPRKVKTGEKLPFVVHEDVVIDGNVVIRAGTPAEVLVTDAQPASSWASRQGRLDFTIEAVLAVDGTRVELKNYKDYAQLGVTPSFGHAYYSNPKIARDQTFLAAVKNDTKVELKTPTEQK